MITLKLQNGDVEMYVYEKRGTIQLELWNKRAQEAVTMELGKSELGVIEEYLGDIADDVANIATRGDLCVG